MIWLFPDQIVRLFVPQGIEGGDWLLRFYAIGFIPLAINYVTTYYYNTIQQRKVAMTLTLCENLVLYLPLIYLLTHALGLPGAVLSFVLAETMALLMELVDKQLADPAIDASRVYVTGISMGGYGTWDLLSRRPDVFAAAMPICGGGDVAQAQKISKVPIWIFHGSADGAVPVCRSRNMAAALWAAGSNAHYREYPDAGHNVWGRTYGDAEVLIWFFKQKKASSL